ncbi:MAG: hypothetical protein JW768_00200 [Chitinispirillaceae bacterium]|nr:hypothetical protein [Chitinispirillaceae bacterium]
MIVNQNLSAVRPTVTRAASAFEAPDPVLTYRDPQYHGFCWPGGHPAYPYYGDAPTCRKEAKELLVVPETRTADGGGMVKPGVSQGVLELLKDNVDVKSTVKKAVAKDIAATTAAAIGGGVRPVEEGKADIAVTPVRDLGVGSAIIGGCCCVHLSIEYMPSLASIGTSLLSPVVLVSVTDSEATTLTWQKSVDPESIYQIRENIIATRPGATLDVIVRNVIARVRWCEVFSC